MPNTLIANILGPPGPPGAPGSAFSTTTSAPFTTPAVGANVPISLTTTAGLAAGVTLFINGAGYYEVESVTSSTAVTAMNLGLPSNDPPGTVVPTASDVLGTGPVGPSGPAGSPGLAGTRGTKWFSGAGVPPDPIPTSLPGDLYLNTTNGDLYEVS